MILFYRQGPLPSMTNSVNLMQPPGRAESEQSFEEFSLKASPKIVKIVFMFWQSQTNSSPLRHCKSDPSHCSYAAVGRRPRPPSSESMTAPRSTHADSPPLGETCSSWRTRWGGYGSPQSSVLSPQSSVLSPQS